MKMKNIIKVYTNYQVNGYHKYYGLTIIKNSLNIEPDSSFYSLPAGYKSVILNDNHPAIECPDGEIITAFTDRDDCPVFKTHDGKYIALKIEKINK